MDLNHSEGMVKKRGMSHRSQGDRQLLVRTGENSQLGSEEKMDIV